MCISGCLHIVLNITLVIAILFTLIAIFTPQWRANSTSIAVMVNQSAGATASQAASSVYSTGVAISNCASTVTGVSSFSSCLGLTNAPGYQQAAVAFLCLTIILSVLAFAFSCIACIACCCGKMFMKPLPIMLGICCLFNIIAVTCYGVGSNNDWNAQLAAIQSVNAASVSATVTGTSNIGYSMWLAIFSIVVFAVDTVLAIFLACLSKVAPMV